jgi:nucleoside-diphosphate-sugar epimerase
MRVAVTGATGYLGSKFVQKLTARGISVCALSRKPVPDVDLRLEFELDRSIPTPEQFRSHNIDVLVHCAYDFSPRTMGEAMRINFNGSRKLFESAFQAEVPRIIYVSSMSSFDGCKSIYGKTKLATEHCVAGLGGISVRPGLVFGNAPGGIMGTIERFIKAFFLIPYIGGKNRNLFLIHDDDLTELLLALCCKEVPRIDGPIICAHWAPLSLRTILKVLIRRKRLLRLLVPIPWRLVWIGLRMLEIMRVPSKLRSDSVLGLIFSDPYPKMQSDLLERLCEAPLLRFDT